MREHGLGRKQNNGHLTINDCSLLNVKFGTGGYGIHDHGIHVRVRVNKLVEHLQKKGSPVMHGRTIRAYARAIVVPGEVVVAAGVRW